jgi:hypothetical protein
MNRKKKNLTQINIFLDRRIRFGGADEERFYMMKSLEIIKNFSGTPFQIRF